MGIRAKLLVAQATIVLLIIGSMVFASILSLRQAFNSEYSDKALAIARAFESHYCSLADLRDSTQAQAHIDRLGTLNSGISSISLFTNEDGRTVVTASSDRGRIGEHAGGREIEAIRDGATSTAEAMTANGAKVLIVSAPVRIDGQPMATVDVELLLAPRDEAVREQAERFALIGTIAAALLLGGLHAALDGLLLKPLSRLKTAAIEIGSGVLGSRISMQRHDELGEVAKEFDKMADGLELREEENQHLHRQLRTNLDQALAASVTDHVTGLCNHRYFQDRLAEALGRAGRLGEPVALLFIDVDLFKQFNDRYGHLSGDQALRAVAAVLRSSVRETDVLARYGGEEFAVIIYGADCDGGLEVGERIRRAVAECRPLPGQGPTSSAALTVSVGVAAFPVDGRSPSRLIESADRAMYDAKDRGRDQVRSHQQLLQTSPR